MRKQLYVLALLLLASCIPSRDRYIQISGYAQGGTYTVKLNMKGVNVQADQIRDNVDALLLTIDTTLSGYIPYILLYPSHSPVNLI